MAAMKNESHMWMWVRVCVCVCVCVFVCAVLGCAECLCLLCAVCSVQCEEGLVDPVRGSLSLAIHSQQPPV